MKIIEQGKKIETKAGEKTFKCTCCNCKWTAEPNEYIMIRTPMKLNGLYHGCTDDIYHKSGVHKDGMGWNANGVWCGKCCKDTCEGCENEHKFFEGFSQETIDRLKKEIMEDDNEHL